MKAAASLHAEPAKSKGKKAVKVHNHLDTFRQVKQPVLTTGTFDGVHIGHRKIISRLREIATQTGGETVLFTFHPHPRTVLFPDDTNLKLLTTQAEKVELLSESGIDHLVVFPFNREFSRLTAIEFVRDVIVNQLHTDRLVIGYDHHFGRNREGSIAELRELAPLYGFGVEEIPPQEVDDVKVSSTKIRHALHTGDVETARNYLGYAYRLTGTVVQGKQLGRQLGFPTANLRVNDPYKLIPADGVYAVTARLGDRQLGGMLNIGKRPTVNAEKSPTSSVEVHLFDFEGDIYEQELRLEFIGRIRDEKKFEGIAELKSRLETDRHLALKILEQA